MTFSINILNLIMSSAEHVELYFIIKVFNFTTLQDNLTVYLSRRLIPSREASCC